MTTLVALVLAERGDLCWLCHTPGADTVDHVRPRSKGGLDTLPNLRPAHRRCNSARGNRDTVPASRPVYTVDDAAFFDGPPAG